MSSMMHVAGREAPASFGKRLEALALTPLLLVVTLGIGWLVWSCLEWRRGRNPSYRILRLHVVRLSDGQPIRLGRSIVRSGICCVLLLPTLLVGAIVGVSFLFGASAPDGLFRDPRRAPWDRFTRTQVTREDIGTLVGGTGPVFQPIDLPMTTASSAARNN
jgi:hypothetical protein